MDDPFEDRYDVVVVGSGFGGSVMAAELASRSDATVCVLERGRAYPPGAFPRTAGAISRSLWAPGRGTLGLYDVRWFEGITTVVSSGLGGGSLIYANVMLPKDDTWFQQRTPNGEFTEHWALRPHHLAEHYAEVLEFLKVQPLPHDTDDVTVPAEFHLAKTAQFLGGMTSDTAQYAPLAVRFDGPDGHPAVAARLLPEPYGNIHGNITRTTCHLIGECDVGCNEGAKSSLDHTYLSLAEHEGASIHTLAEVTGLALDDDPTHRFTVTVQIHRADPSAPADDGTAHERVIRARRVVLAAGTLGSTHLLLRNAAALGLTAATQANAALGSRFCGNGDFLSAVTSTEDEVTCWDGPVITAYRRYPAETDPGDDGSGNRHGMYIEDAGFPNVASWAARWGADETVEGFADEVDQSLEGYVDPAVASDVRLAGLGWEFTRHFMPLLGMGRDQPDGRLSLDDDGRLRCDWTADSSQAYYELMNERMAAIAADMGGSYVRNPLYDIGNRVITVHPVGGCPMDTSMQEGVVDTYGRVRGVPGLRVCDGSVFPGPIGPNPSLTIAAFARRSADNLLGEGDFTAPPSRADPWSNA